MSWFFAVIHKYRRILCEVLIGSFFLQLLGLVTPLFFQVVIDKVLVHRGLSTLDVLAIGLVAGRRCSRSCWAAFGPISSPTRPTASTWSWARGCSVTCCALPLAYFEARRVGDTVARVRELENIRQFLTGSALTLVLDLCSPSSSWRDVLLQRHC